MLEEAQELGVGVPLIAPVSHQPSRDFQRREQRRFAVALGVVGLFLGDLWAHRQDRCGPVQRLDLGFLIDAHDHRLSLDPPSGDLLEA